MPWDRGENQGFRVKQTVSLSGPVANGCPPLVEGSLRLFPHQEGGCDDAFQSFAEGEGAQHVWPLASLAHLSCCLGQEISSLGLSLLLWEEWVPPFLPRCLLQLSESDSPYSNPCRGSSLPAGRTPRLLAQSPKSPRVFLLCLVPAPAGLLHETPPLHSCPEAACLKTSLYFFQKSLSAPHLQCLSHRHFISQHCLAIWTPFTPASPLKTSQALLKPGRWQEGAWRRGLGR